VSNQRLIDYAEIIWNNARPLSSDPDIVEYLAKRGVAPLAQSSDQLKQFGLFHKSMSVPMGSYLLARIWHVQKGFLGFHATKIEHYGRDIRRTVGACQGGGVWFGNASPTTELVVGEGIETTLSAMILWGAAAGVATLGTAGLQALVLPHATRRVVIAADNDAPVYDKNGRRLPNGMAAARDAKRGWEEMNPCVDVQIKMPKKIGSDWNDVLMEANHA
jgi:hypothetical protein